MLNAKHLQNVGGKEKNKDQIHQTQFLLLIERPGTSKSLLLKNQTHNMGEGMKICRQLPVAESQPIFTNLNVVFFDIFISEKCLELLKTLVKFLLLYICTDQNKLEKLDFH